MRHGRGALRALHVEDQRREPVAAPPRQGESVVGVVGLAQRACRQIRRSQPILQPRGGPAQQQGAGRVAHAVIDVLEIVQAPPSPASLLAWVAMVSVTLALSLICEINALIRSIEAVVSSTPEACSLARWLRLCAVALTWLAAPVSALTPSHSNLIGPYLPAN